MDIFGDLELFEDLAEHGSFSAVARRRGQVASSVSRRLDRLEAHLGQRLFNRAPTGLFLTAAGERKLAEARHLTRAVAAFAETDADTGGLSGHIVIAAPARLGAVCVAPVVSDFLAEHPATAIDLHLTDEVQDLDRDRIDLAVRIGGASPDHHIIRRIANNIRILVAAPDYLERHGTPQSPEDLETCEGLMLGEAGGWRLRGPNGAMYHARPKVRLRCIAGNVLRSMCEAGHGVALKSSWDAAAALKEGSLLRILPDWQQDSTSDVMIVTPSRRLVSPTLKAFEKRLAAHLKSILALDQP